MSVTHVGALLAAGEPRAGADRGARRVCQSGRLFFDRKPAHPEPWTQKIWVYDLRTNKEFTLKTRPLKRADLDEFVSVYNATNRHERAETWSDANPTGRWRAYGYDELIAHDKVSLDIFWLRDESLEDSANLPDPDVLAQEIMDDLEAALAQFSEVHSTSVGVGGKLYAEV